MDNKTLMKISSFVGEWKWIKLFLFLKNKVGYVVYKKYILNITRIPYLGSFISSIVSITFYLLATNWEAVW